MPRSLRGTLLWAEDTSCPAFSKAAAQGSTSALPWLVHPQACSCGSHPSESWSLSHDQNRLCFSPQSPKGFLESYEEMMVYALRPETWATTRLELEGRGVSWFMLSPSAVGSLVPEILEQGGGCLCGALP